jgi:ankyrin repeat protein
VVRTLLEAGADPRLKDNFGHTAMWEAVHSARDDIIELLAKQGGEGVLGAHQESALSPATDIASPPGALHCRPGRHHRSWL